MVKRARYTVVDGQVVEERVPVEIASPRGPVPPPDPQLPHGGYVESNGRLIPIGVYL
jgi:hypothetical protein